MTKRNSNGEFAVGGRLAADSGRAGASEGQAGVPSLFGLRSALRASLTNFSDTSEAH